MGGAISGQVISAVGDETKVAFPEGNGALTDDGGVATIKVARATLLSSGADNITLTYNFRAGALETYSNGSKVPEADKVISKYVGYQMTPANISMSNLNVGSTNLGAYGTRTISVQVNIDAAPALNTSIPVNFTSSCGVIFPVVASTDSAGVARVSYSAVNAGSTNDQGCSGTAVSISASTPGATPLTATLSVALAPATNLLFQSASPSTIYLAESGAATQSIVKFKLVNANNVPLQGQNIVLSLNDLGGGVYGLPKTTFETLGNASPVTKPTDANGEVSVPVFSGGVPTSVVVTASLEANDAVVTTSSLLVIASGRAAQARTSLSVEAFAIEGAQIDGTTTRVKMALADRQGNPVPDGTPVNFVTEGGVMTPPTCTTVNSECSVLLRSQNPRPVDGLVSVLAYAPGEEDFVDKNFDNVYTEGEVFTDLGWAFRDDSSVVSNDPGQWLTNRGYFVVPRAGEKPCNSPVNYLGVTEKCDGKWGAIDVRRQVVVAFATSMASITGANWVRVQNPAYDGAPLVANTLTVAVQDLNGNSMPAGSALWAEAVDKTPSTPAKGTDVKSCTVESQSLSLVPNTLSPVPLQLNLKDCVANDQIQVIVTSPSGVRTVEFFTVPSGP